MLSYAVYCDVAGIERKETQTKKRNRFKAIEAEQEIIWRGLHNKPSKKQKENKERKKKQTQAKKQAKRKVIKVKKNLLILDWIHT